MKRFFTAFLVASSLILQLGFFSCTTKPTEYAILIDSLTVDSICPLFHTYEKPACHFSLKMAVPYVEENSELSHSIERFLASIPRQGAFASDGDGSLQSMADNYLHTYVLQYLEEGKEAIDSYGEDLQAAATWMSYEETVTGEVASVQEQFLSYQMKIFSFMGGAHGNLITLNRVFDMANQQTLSLANLFSEESLVVVAEKIRLDLAHQNDCETLDDLVAKSIFFSVNDIEPNDNFLLNNEGIVWTYDPYEIAPYVYGTIEVMLPWKEIVNLLDPDSPLDAFVESKTANV